MEHLHNMPAKNDTSLPKEYPLKVSLIVTSALRRDTYISVD